MIWNNYTNTNTNTNTNVINNTTNTTNTTNTDQSQENANEQRQIVPRTEPIVINMPLNTNTSYYLWIKDEHNYAWYQVFKIQKGEIVRR